VRFIWTQRSPTSRQLCSVRLLGNQLRVRHNRGNLVEQVGVNQGQAQAKGSPTDRLNATSVVVTDSSHGTVQIDGTDRQQRV